MTCRSKAARSPISASKLLPMPTRSNSTKSEARDKAGVAVQKAQNNRDTFAKLLADAKAKCTPEGFAKFKVKYVPTMRKSRIYELLQIGSGQKTADELRPEKRESVAKTRANKVSTASAVVATQTTEPVSNADLTGSVGDFSPAAQAQIAAAAGKPPEEKTKRAVSAKPLPGPKQGTSEWYLEQFRQACWNYLPKITEEAHRATARKLVSELTTKGIKPQLKAAPVPAGNITTKVGTGGKSEVVIAPPVVPILANGNDQPADDTAKARMAENALLSADVDTTKSKH